MGISTLLNGSLGFAMLIALLFCIPDDIQPAIDSVTQYPFIDIYNHAVGSKFGATAMASIIIATLTLGGIGILATASRMLWAFSREGGIPFSSHIAKVDQKTFLPLYAIAVTTTISLLLALINIGSSVGFEALISLVVASYYSSFILAAIVMLIKRLTTPDSEIPWGPFRLGIAGVPLTILAIAYSILGAFWSLWPSTVHPSAKDLNYCVIVYGGVMIISIIFWFAYGRKHYVGPKLEMQS